jgi:hypothetical protein
LPTLYGTLLAVRMSRSSAGWGYTSTSAPGPIGSRAVARRKPAASSAAWKSRPTRPGRPALGEWAAQPAAPNPREGGRRGARLLLLTAYAGDLLRRETGTPPRVDELAARGYEGLRRSERGSPRSDRTHPPGSSAATPRASGGSSSSSAGRYAGPASPRQAAQSRRLPRPVPGRARHRQPRSAADRSPGARTTPRRKHRGGRERRRRHPRRPLFLSPRAARRWRPRRGRNR